MNRFVLIALCVVACACACARPPIESYDTSCEVADDCGYVSTNQSQSCGDACNCANHAINAEEVERFNREQAPVCLLPSGIECLCSIPGPLACVDGTCAINEEP